MSQVYYVPFPDTVDTVTILEEGDGGRNFRRQKVSPVVVRSTITGEEFVIESAMLYRNALSASIASAEMQRKIEEELA